MRRSWRRTSSSAAGVDGGPSGADASSDDEGGGGCGGWVFASDERVELAPVDAVLAAEASLLLYRAI